MSIVSLANVSTAPAEAVALYDKYRQQIAQVKAGVPSKKLKQELLADCTALKLNCGMDCRDCIDEITDYLLKCFVEEYIELSRES